jgi:hypothetical protein
MLALGVGQENPGPAVVIGHGQHMGPQGRVIAPIRRLHARAKYPAARSHFYAGHLRRVKRYVPVALTANRLNLSPIE